MNKVGVWSPVIWKIQPFVDKDFIDGVLFFYFTQRFSDENTDHVSSSFSSSATGSLSTAGNRTHEG